MQNWFDANGTSNWLNAMDEQTTTIDGFDSVLDCKPLGGNTCPAPVTPCNQFTPPELRLIRIAATNAHDFFTYAREKLQDTTLTQGLNINKIIADFAPDPPGAGFNPLPAISSGFAIASTLVGFGSAGAGGALGIIGSYPAL